MKKSTISFLLLMISCPAWAGPLMDAAQEASKEPLKVITTPLPKQTEEPQFPRTPEESAAKQKAMFREIEMNAMGLTWAEWQAALELKAKNEKAFRDNFLYSMRGDYTDNFNVMVATDLCKRYNARFPGSNVNCLVGGGTWVSGAAQGVFQDWRAIEYQDKSEGPITWSVSYPQQVVKYSDNNQNQLTFKIFGPNQAQVIEARLPDMADASLDVIPRDVQKKAFNVKSNFLIQLLNDVYEARWKDKVGMASYCHDILSSPQNRQLVIEQATEIYTQPSQKQKKSK